MEEFERTYCIQGYHMYKEIWEEAVGEELLEKSWCVQENPTTVTVVTVFGSLRDLAIGQDNCL